MSILDRPDSPFNVRPASAPTLGDESVAYTGRIKGDGPPLDVAVLIVKSNENVHTWVGMGLSSDPLDSLLSVAESAFAENGGSSPGG